MELRILGPLEVEASGGALPLGDRQQRALLALLALRANEVVSTDAIADALWGERPPPTAQTALHGLVSVLRRALGDDRERLLTRPPGYLLHLERDELDAERFARLAAAGRAALEEGDATGASSRLAEALALWRGPALADFVHDEFARDEAARLEEVRLATLENRVDADLSLGRHAALVPELEALVARHPLRERLTGQLMLALYRSGRPADALAAFTDARRALAQLGLDPGPQLRRVERAVLRHDHTLELPEQPAATTPGPPSDYDELKPVTALFADVVGSTALGERLAPEEVKALVGECVTAMSRAVEEHGGVVQAYTGDGICAYFGVPAAHGDDPERAARAALRILDVMAGYAADVEAAWSVRGFSVRVGVNSGQAAVGAVGAAAPQLVAVGDMTNVAARLEAAADPGTALVGRETAARLVHRFALEVVGAIEVKNRRQPVEAVRLVGPLAKGRRGSAPLLGRDDELTRLERALADVRDGRGQVLLLVGEEGIGKSRLLSEARGRAGESVTWVEGTCVGYGPGEREPFAELLRRWLGVEEGDAAISVRMKSRARLAPLLGGGVDEALGPLTRLLEGVADEGDSADAALLGWLEALAVRGPLVVALEDAHLADAASGRLVEALFELSERAPVLVVLTLAPERETEGWRLRLRALDLHAHRTIELPVGPLDEDAAAHVLRALLPGALDDEARRTLIARAEGNPLYLEELLRGLIEGGGIEDRHRTWTLTSAAARLLPPSIENLLVARVDRLPPGARALAQLAAVLGRTFPVDVLRRLANGVDEPLGQLLRAGVVRELRRFPELECGFRHGLLREAALSTLTEARRRELYGRAARAWEEHYGAAGGGAERLAHYLARSGEGERANEVLHRARPPVS